MNALIDLTKCREYMTVTVGGRDHQIKLGGTIEDPYFCGKDVCNVLGYKSSKKAVLTHVKSKHKKELSQLVGPNEPLTYNNGKTVYINTSGLEQLVYKSKICGPDTLSELVRAFNLNISIVPRKEIDHLEAIERTFSHLKMFKQFKVGRYRVDLYIEEYDLVIECDEYDHKYRDPNAEKTREEFIRRELACYFIRFNPNYKGFSIFSVIGDIHRFIFDKSVNQKDLIIEKKNIKIKLLRDQLN